jgi:hypothetical protein
MAAISYTRHHFRFPQTGDGMALKRCKRQQQSASRVRAGAALAAPRVLITSLFTFLTNPGADFLGPFAGTDAHNRCKHAFVLGPFANFGSPAQDTKHQRRERDAL